MKKLFPASAAAAALAGALVVGIGSAPAARAQSTTAARAEFDVASVKLVDHPVEVHPYRLDINHGTLRIDAVPLRFIIGLAYDPQAQRGGPGWIDDERYDIQAKAPNPSAGRDEIRAMLQTLLSDRFKLIFHTETRQLSVYTLVVGNGGAKLKKAEDDEQPNINRRSGSEVHVTFQKWPIKGLANTLSGILGTPVRDETGLAGMYDFTLEWVPDESPNPGPSIFAAVEEQLGLKLEAGKGPVDVMVIDHVEHATQN